MKTSRAGEQLALFPTPPPTLPPPALAQKLTTPDNAPGGDTENH